MNLLWAKSAKSDISNIEEYYLNIGVPKDIIYGVMFDLSKTSKMLKEFPLIGTILEEGKIRKYPLTKYPYMILYQVEIDSVKIIRVLDTRNNNF